MKNFLFIILLGLLVGFSSCKKDNYYLYDDIGRIQFGPDPSYQYSSGDELRDTVKAFTFVYEADTVKRETVYFDIYTVGGTTAKDRYFKLSQIQLDGVNNAEAGKHYIGFDNEKAAMNFVIKADSVHAKVPIILLRDVSLKDTGVVLKFEVVAGDDFSVGQASNLWRQVEFTDQLRKPDAWNDFLSQYILGNYSTVKHNFMIEATGQKWDDDFITMIYADYGLLLYWKGLCSTALLKYNKEHPGNPLKDEFGQLVIFP